ncbi:GAF domain-containing sensor histidine kinase [Microbacterium sp. W1N]|uniref:sensor histidine kinase n=1 Tax=Microbacterium festucae TaxID=2977531 RepID=UPI0021C0CF5F|nr:GAF domain-containing sensor histidine kinase [Microbacterium festucae]MCT9821295.1 GAF domain-containing sensor histidine kinase [Microbacterium festucae]
MTTTIEERVRVEAIARYDVLTGPAEPDLEGLVQLAASLCAVPKAVINIIDERHQHQVAAVGFEPDVCSREDSMCTVVLTEKRPISVSDARIDARFASNPFVTGEIAHVRFYASSPLRTPEGVIIGTLCVFDDETGELAPSQSEGLNLLAHQVVDVLELRRLTRELGRSNEQLASFAGRVSHDLRNPLTALVGYLEIAADSPDMAAAPGAARAIAQAEGAAGRMTDMVTDLLDYARVGGAHPKRTEVALSEILGGALGDLDAAIRAAGATIVVDADATVTGDPTLLRVLFQNLLANALKFAPAAGAAPFIEVTAESDPLGWRITVDDNGPGVPEAERESVFDLLTRGSDTAAPGLGIGLSTCRHIVHAHGGHIGIEESPAGGARVWILLPHTPA